MPVDAAAGVGAVPGVAALERGQDRLHEKELFRSLGIPTARFGDLEATGVPALVKTRRLGYDGKGQRRVETIEPLADGELAEELVPFDRELSIVGVRGRDGETRFWPVGENVHREGILRVTRVPGQDAPQAEAEAICTTLLDALDYVGVLAVELFEVGGRLLANEFAPRVHNTGHWTIDGAVTSQFENHLRAILGLPLGATEATGRSVMVNLVGSVPPLAGARRASRRARAPLREGATRRAKGRSRHAHRPGRGDRRARDRARGGGLARVGSALGAAARVRVRTVVRVAAVSVGDVRVALGGRDVGVPEHLLDAPQVGTALEQVGGERVAQEVGVDATRLQAGPLGEAAEDEERACARQRAATRVQEEVGSMAPVEVRSAEREVAARGLRRRPPERDEPLLAALADHADDAGVEVDRGAGEPEGLRDAEPGAVEQLDERLVAHRPRRRPVRRIDEPLRLRGGERPRHGARPARAGDARGGVVAAYPDQRQVAQVRADGREPPCDRRGGAPVGAHRGEPGLELLRRRAADRAVERCGTGGKVAAVRIHGPRRAAGREEQQEALDVGIGASAHRGGTRFGGEARAPARHRSALTEIGL